MVCTIGRDSGIGRHARLCESFSLFLFSAMVVLSVSGEPLFSFGGGVCFFCECWDLWDGCGDRTARAGRTSVDDGNIFKMAFLRCIVAGVRKCPVRESCASRSRWLPLV